MFRSSLAALLILSVTALHAEPQKPASPVPAPKAAKPTAETAKKEPAKPAAKPAVKPAKPAGPIDPADQALLDHAAKELKKLTPAQTASLLTLANEGKPEDLQAIPGIGETKSAAIKKARPLKSADQLIMVDGIGEVTFDGMVKWVKDGMPKDTPATKPDPKAKPAVKPAPKK